MKRLFLMLALVLAAAVGVKAENYPYRSDVLWVTTPDHADWVYKTGEQAKVEVQLLRYGIPQDGVTVVYELGADRMPADAKGTVVLKNGRAVIPVGTMKVSGFRDCRLTAKIGDNIFRHHVKVGFSPEQIEPYTRMPDDFDDFWSHNKAEAARYPLTYTREKAPEYCTDKIDCWLVRVQLNSRGQSVYAYLTMPKNARAGQHPVVLCPPGAGVKTIKEPLRHKYYAEQGCIRMEMEIHGLDPRLPPEQFTQITRALNTGDNGYMCNGLDNRDNFYMKRVFLACVRCIDLLTSLPEWDGRNVILQGGSQGGALSIITAALDPRVTACVANHPAMSDMAGFKASRADGWPHFSTMNGMDTPEKIRTMAYYDVVNFARRLKVPCYMTWGFNDNVCPPTTSYAVYNVMTCPKEALITPINEHWTSDTTEQGHLAWILQHLK